MSRFRTLKQSLREGLGSARWEALRLQLDVQPPQELIGPLLACLPLDEQRRDRAAEALGRAVARMADERMEEGRNVLRRLMWHMNEESGNIGWGIPEAFAEVLCQHEGLAREFAPILVSYITKTGKDDNFCDLDVLRRSCFAGVAHLIAVRPEFAALARGPLQAGLTDEDPVCREIARNTLDSIGLF